MTTATTSSTRTKDSHDAPHGAAAAGDVSSTQPPARPVEPEVVEHDDAYDNVACTD
jgi:hypothetical protein